MAALLCSLRRRLASVIQFPQIGDNAVSLLPLLTAQTSNRHDALYWSKGPEGEWAVRRGDWKVRFLKGQKELFNLADDPSERSNLAAANPAIVRELSEALEAWIEPMGEPITGGSKRWTANADQAKPAKRAREENDQRPAKRRRDAAKK